jgi:hypothetical protein
VDVQYFRVWLAHILRLRGADVRRRFSNRLPTAEELDEIALLLSLARDARNVSDHVVLLFYQMLSVDGIAARVSPVVDDCLGRIGRDLFPRDATELVREAMREACYPSRPGRPATLPAERLVRPVASGIAQHIRRDSAQDQGRGARGRAPTSGRVIP